MILIKINSHELQSETGLWSIPKTLWNDIIWQICDSKHVEDENHTFLDFPTLTHVHSQFPTICHTSNLLDLLSQSTYNDLGALISLLFDHRNKILKNQT